MASKRDKLKAKIKADAKGNRDRKKKFGKFASYDAASQGGAGFGKQDLKYLQKKGWSNNDILKAAASTNSVSAGADRQLGMLNQALDPDNKIDRNILEKGRGVLGYQGMAAASNGTDIRFLGGDPKKKKNWLIGNAVNEAGGNRADWEVTAAGAGPFGTGRGMAHPGQRYGDTTKKQAVHQWNGRNADGTANGLGGFEHKFGNSNDPLVRTASWSMPRGLANMRFAERMDQAEKHRTPDDELTGSDDSVKGDDTPDALPTYDVTPSGADYGVKPFDMNTGTSIFDAFADSIGHGTRFAASQAVKQRLGFA